MMAPSWSYSMEASMNPREAIKLSIDMGDLVAMGYLEDLTDADLFHRPAPKANHINWQLGHLIASTNFHLSKAAPGTEKPLPAGFAEKYTKETAASDDPKDFLTKDELLRVRAEQREAMLAALERQSDADFDKPTGVDYAPTVGAMFSVEGSHWLMHAGQWAVIRRQLGRKPLF
jgi:hypothetical protein